MRYFIFTGACALALTYASAAVADGNKQPNDHAPIGVMGDHLHQQGEWMIGYHYKHSRTSGYRNGSNRVSNASVMDAYGEAAVEMDMGMHMLEVMYGVTDDFTLMVMPHYMRMDMTHASSHGRGHIHDHSVKGLGDTEVTGLYSLYDDNTDTGTDHKAHLNFGFSLPTGSIGEPPRGKPRGITSAFSRVQAALAPCLPVPVAECTLRSQSH